MASSVWAMKVGKDTTEWLIEHPTIGTPVGGALARGVVGGYIGHQFNDAYGGASEVPSEVPLAVESEVV